MLARTTTRDLLKFQFVLGGLPGDSRPGQNIQGNMTVTYIVPLTDCFSLGDLRQVVERDHDDMMKQATRAKNQLRRNEKFGIAQISIEGVRNWFTSAREEELQEALEHVKVSNATAWLDNSPTCRVVITPQHSSATVL